MVQLHCLLVCLSSDPTRYINSVKFWHLLSFLNEANYSVLRHNTMCNNKHDNRAYSAFKAQVINHMKKGESAAKLLQELSIATS